MTNIINFGSCNIDHVYSVSHFVNPGETIYSNAFNCFPGGKGLNQSVAIAKSGARVYHAGCIGKDGEFLRKVLCDVKVDVSHLKMLDAPTGHAIIQVDDAGENCIIIHTGTNGMIEPDFIDGVINNFNENDIIVLQNEISNLEYIVDKAYEKGMRIVLNPSPFNKTMRELDLSKISLLILNEVEAYEFSGEKVTEKVMAWFRENYSDLKVVLTLGSKGSTYFDRYEQIFCAAYSVDVKDTTAAGDTFTGYFVSGLVKELDIKTNLKYAALAAAIAVSREGAAVSIPYMDEVEAALSVLKPNTYDESQLVKKINMVNTYIEENLGTANLDELAAMMGYSKSHLTVWMRRYMGKSFLSILQDKRCNRAAQLLCETDLPIEEIIRISGYENGSFFRKKFNAYFGKSPLEYRRFYSGNGKNK